MGIDLPYVTKGLKKNRYLQWPPSSTVAKSVALTTWTLLGEGSSTGSDDTCIDVERDLLMSLVVEIERAIQGIRLKIEKEGMGEGKEVLHGERWYM